MPKLYNTKRQRALKLLERLERGPTLSVLGQTKVINTEDAERQVKLWLDSWITEEVIDLIPELRNNQ